MNAIDVENGLAFAAALGLATLLGAALAPANEPARTRPQDDDAAIVPERTPDGMPALRDATGTLVPLRSYQRIASASLVSDRVLADLSAPDRVVAFTRHALETPSGHRYEGKATLSARDDLERLLARAPDLVLVSDLVDAGYVARLRERGVQVFDLGPQRGLETLLGDIRAIGVLIGEPQRADVYARTLVRRMRAVRATHEGRPGPRALYLGIYGDRLFGAGDHTSYHDVIVHAGLRDAIAEDGLSGWPELTSEQLLTLAPDVIVTRTGMSPILCRHPGLDRLGPCRGEGRLLELDGALLDDPGPGMLDATEALAAAFWGDWAGQGASPSEGVRH